MSNHDYRALCAELVAAFEIQLDELRFNNRLCIRARAALAQPEPQGPTDEELLAAAAAAIDPYQNSGIAIGEYEAETECALEVYGSELIAFARAVLARWGRPANTIN
jgi:hypothetical protein